MSWDNTKFQTQKAIRRRTCWVCNNKIEAGELFVSFNSNSMYSKNCCELCMNDISNEISKHNSRLEVKE